MLAEPAESIQRNVQYWVLSPGLAAAERGILMAGRVVLKASDREVSERVHTFVRSERDQLKVEKFVLTDRGFSAKLESIFKPAGFVREDFSNKYWMQPFSRRFDAFRKLMVNSLLNNYQ